MDINVLKKGEHTGSPVQDSKIEAKTSGEDKETRAVTRIAEIYMREYPTWEKVYNEIEKGYNFLAGEQYTAEQIAYFDLKRRPTRVFNLVFTIFNQVLGNFFLTNEKMRVYPKQGGDAATAAALEDVIDTLALNSECKEHTGKVLLAGMNRLGVMYPRYSDELQIDGSLVFGNVDEFEVMWDSRAKRDFADDAAYFMRSRWMDKEQILRGWPQHRRKLEGSLRDKDDWWKSGNLGLDVRRNFQHRYFVQEHENEGQYRVIEFHEKVWERTPVLVDVRTGESEICQLEGKKLDLYLRLHPDMKLVEQEQEVKKIIEVIPALNFYLGEREAQVQDKQWDYVIYQPFAYGKFTHLNFGMMKNALGPQQYLNDLENIKMDILNKSANVGFNIKPDNIKNYEQFLQSGAEPGFNMEFETNANIADSFQERKAPSIPTGHLEMSQGAMDFLFKITNAHANFMGAQQSTNENASLFAQRVRQSQVNLAVADYYFRWMKRRVYNKGIKLIQQNVTMERYFLITDPKTKEMGQVGLNVQVADNVLNNVTLGEYQVGMDDLERNPTARAVRFIEKMELGKFVIEALGAAAMDWEWLLEEADFGDIEKLVEKIKQSLEAAGASAEQAEAFAGTEQLMALAQKKLQLDGGDSQGLPKNGPKRAAV